MVTPEPNYPVTARPEYSKTASEQEKMLKQTLQRLWWSLMRKGKRNLSRKLKKRQKKTIEGINKSIRECQESQEKKSK